MKQVLALIILAIISSTASAKNVAASFACKGDAPSDRAVARIEGDAIQMKSLSVGKLHFNKIVKAVQLTEGVREAFFQDDSHDFEAGVIFGKDSSRISVIVTEDKDSDAAIFAYNCELAS